jgi:polyisoprenoid-binding protein YceI
MMGNLRMLLACGPAAAQGVALDKSEIRFVATQLGVKVEGVFRKFKAHVIFRPKALAASKADFEIELGSVDLASEDSEKEVKGPLWFDTARFPVARFTSSAFKEVGAGRYDVSGKLSIKGLTRDLVVPVTVTPDAVGGWVAQGTFPVKRLDFKVGEGLWSDTDTIAELIQVRFRMVLPPQT